MKKEEVLRMSVGEFLNKMNVQLDKASTPLDIRYYAQAVDCLDKMIDGYIRDNSTVDEYIDYLWETMEKQTITTDVPNVVIKNYHLK